MSNGQLPRSQLIRMASVRFLGAVLVLGAMLFGSAGTWAYWEALVYLAILFGPVLFVLAYLLKENPELLERRMRMKEKEPQQKWVIGLSYLYVLVTFLLPGFDRRFEWSDVPVLVVVVADVLALLGYGTFFLVLRENRYASRIIEVERGQKVITSGPYAMVRHPMYVGVTVLYVVSPLALGSYWAMLSALLIIPLIVARIRNEEGVLARELEGYREYMQKTRYRLVPGIW